MMGESAMAIGLLVLLGTLTGFISGMLGIGGGTVVVPALVFGLPLLGIGGPDVPKIAVATSLALVIPTSIASAQAHAAKGSIDWRMLALLAPSIAAGALVTAVFAARLNPHLVMLVFILFALFTAWGLIRSRNVAQVPGVTSKPGALSVAARGAVGGVLSSLLGLGVGFFCVPLLSKFLSMQRAIGTAAALALPMAIIGTAGYLLAASPGGCAGQCSGYVFLPAVAAIGISAVLAAPLGAWAAHVMPVGALKRAFAVFLLVAAANLTYKTFTPAVIASEMQRIAVLGEQAILLVTARLQPAEGACPHLETASFAPPPNAGAMLMPLVVNLDDSGARTAQDFFSRSRRERPDWFVAAAGQKPQQAHKEEATATLTSPGANPQETPVPAAAVVSTVKAATQNAGAAAGLQSAGTASAQPVQALQPALPVAAKTEAVPVDVKAGALPVAPKVEGGARSVTTATASPQATTSPQVASPPPGNRQPRQGARAKHPTPTKKPVSDAQSSFF